MIWAYAICEPAAAAPPPRRRGLGGATLRALQNDGLAAVYSRHRSLRPRPLPALVLAHERVIEAVMARGPVLPLRYGTQLAGEERLEGVLAERHDELLGALERVRGHVEMGVRVLPKRPSKPSREAAGGSGRAYLMARAGAHARAERAARDLYAPLAELAAASRITGPPAARETLVAAYLVPSEAVDGFRARGAELAARHEDLWVVVSGPWPPYNFASSEAPG